jgi:MoaA/NifB/PqqE/SkfB family radical SAM enzyme
VRLEQIRALHIELTTRCNARCPMCMRNYRGSNFNSGYPLTELTLSDIKKIFTPNFLKNIQSIQFCGNLGDFGLCRDAIQIVEYFLQHCEAEICIETNGSIRTPDWWAQLVSPKVIIYFALDGLADTHTLYRQNTDWQKVIDNASAFIKAGGRAIWKFIPFEHNKHQIEECEKLSKEMGFEEFSIWDQGRNQGPVYTSNGNFSHWLGIPDPNGPPPIDSLLEDHLNWFDPETVIAKTDISDNLKIDCHHKNTSQIYIAADGSVYPCCWLGYFPKSMHQPGNIQIKNLVSENNALEHSLEHAIEWFDRVYESWKIRTVQDGKLFTCLQACGRCN